MEDNRVTGKRCVIFSCERKRESDIERVLRPPPALTLSFFISIFELFAIYDGGPGIYRAGCFNLWPVETLSHNVCLFVFCLCRRHSNALAGPRNRHSNSIYTNSALPSDNHCVSRILWKKSGPSSFRTTTAITAPHIGWKI